MLKKYKRFLKEFDKKLKKHFTEQSKYICCKEGCSACCEIGDYPFTQLEMMYLMEGYSNLPTEIKIKVRDNLLKIKQNRFSSHLFYKCPFLINNRCSVYDYRGLTCRTFGLAYLIDKKTVKVPECVNQGLCYSDVYENGEISIEPIKENLNLPDITVSKLAKSYKLEFGESRSLIDWFPN